jgi:hypothetical protein
VISPSQRPQPTKNTKDKHPCFSAGFETATPEIEGLQSYALIRTATGIGYEVFTVLKEDFKWPVQTQTKK